MANAEIFGLSETIRGEVEGERVLVHKTHFRTAEDAAIPPGQAIEFEFHVAVFPFHLFIGHRDDAIGTTARVVGGTGTGDGRGATGRGATGRGATGRGAAGREATGRGAAGRAGAGRAGRGRAAALDAGRSGGLVDVGTTIPTPTNPPGTTTVLARRRPVGLPDFRLGGFELPPDWPPPPPPDIDAVIPFEITLTPPSGLRPLVFTNPRYSQIKQWPLQNARMDPAYMRRARGLWKITIRNINEKAKRLTVTLTSIHAETPVSHQDIPLSLLNTLASVALQKVLPVIRYDNGNIIVETSSDLLDAHGIDRVFSLGAAAAKVVDNLPTFTPAWARIMSRADFRARLVERRTQIEAEFSAYVANTLRGRPLPLDLFNSLRNAREAYDQAISKLDSRLDRQVAFCLVLDGMFTNPEVDLHLVGTVAEVENTLPQIGLLFNENFGFEDVISNLAIDLSPALTKVVLATAAVTIITAPVLGPLALIGGYKLYNSIDDLDLEEEMRKKIREKGPLIADYVKRIFERVTDIGAVGLHVKINPRAAVDGSDNLHIKYFNPSTARPPRPWRPTDETLGPTTETMEIGAGVIERRAPAAITLSRPSRRRSEPRREVVIEDGPFGRQNAGHIPSDFKVPGRETLRRLDDHACIVVVMMENRSFDHFFYDLSLSHPNKGYGRPPASYRNTPPPGFVEPLAAVPRAEIGLGYNLKFSASRSSDPSHNYDHTVFQIGGGTAETKGSGQMKGFAVDFALKSDSPQIVMSYFSMDDLPVFKTLANYYPICDRWFAALPVGTYPNRLSMLQGNVPFLYNLQMEDPSIGYLEDYSILDVLNSQGISWKFFESDIATHRLYDRFRLDVRNSRPIGELDETLQKASQPGGALPRVMFIEPHFLHGNDDHPPQDVRQGQAFLRDVIGKFIAHGHLDKTLFVITYDEHGGFFDHIAPPGTDAALQLERRASVRGGAKYGAVEPLFPQDPATAPTSLGVRVPSLVLSKWASPQANHTILDHTAILKTILLHNRRKISTAQFGRFGDRVKKRNHLGLVLDLEAPRTIDYAALGAELNQATAEPSLVPAVVSGDAVGMDSSHPASVLRGIAMPRARTIVEKKE